ncbi:unnamed protein product, partial [Iphiclides podalirius]
MGSTTNYLIMPDNGLGKYDAANKKKTRAAALTNKNWINDCYREWNLSYVTHSDLAIRVHVNPRLSSLDVAKRAEQCGRETSTARINIKPMCASTMIVN